MRYDVGDIVKEKFVQDINKNVLTSNNGKYPPIYIYVKWPFQIL